jgi:hypothetical protein
MCDKPQFTLNSFLDHINYNNIYQLPYKNVQILAAQARSEGRIQRLTGKDLIKRIIEHEAFRLQLYDQYIINSATDYIWNIHSASSQRDLFTNIANETNIINPIRFSRTNNSETIDRITRIITPQTDNTFDDFFNGTKFYYSDVLKF